MYTDSGMANLNMLHAEHVVDSTKHLIQQW